MGLSLLTRIYQLFGIVIYFVFTPFIWPSLVLWTRQYCIARGRVSSYRSISMCFESCWMPVTMAYRASVHSPGSLALGAAVSNVNRRHLLDCRR